MQTNKSCTISLRKKQSNRHQKHITTTQNTHFRFYPPTLPSIHTHTHPTHSPTPTYTHPPLLTPHITPSVPPTLLPRGPHTPPAHTQRIHNWCIYAKRTDSDRMYTFQEHNISKQKDLQLEK